MKLAVILFNLGGPDGPEAVKKVLSVSLEKVRNGAIDTGSTYTNEFVNGN